jgi:hypothetical protein
MMKINIVYLNDDNNMLGLNSEVCNKQNNQKLRMFYEVEVILNMFRRLSGVKVSKNR